MEEINIAIIGDKNVGKSKLCELFCCNKIGSMNDCYSETIEHSYVKSCLFKNKKYVIKLNEVGGSKEYKILLPQIIKKCSCYIIVFSINDRNSFDNLQYYIDTIKANSNQIDPPIFFVCNKVDLKIQQKVFLYEIEHYSKHLGYKYQMTNFLDIKSTTLLFLKIIKEHAKIKKYKELEKSKWSILNYEYTIKTIKSYIKKCIK